MNKILTYGFALVGLAALFWACGSGEVAVYTPEDEYMAYAIDGDDDGSDGDGGDDGDYLKGDVKIK